MATLQRGFDLPSRLRRRGGVPIVSSSGTSGWHDQAMVKAPGVVTGRYGTIGEVFFEGVDFWPLNTTLWVSNFHGNDERFVYYLLQRVNFKAHSGKSGVPGVNRNDLHTELVSLPLSIKEQRAIAGALSDCDDLIITLERQIAKKQAIKQGMMQQLLTGKTRLPGFTGQWHEVLLGNHVSYVKTVALSRAQLDVESPVRYLHYGDIHTRNSVTLDAAHEAMPRASSSLLRNAGRLQVGDLVFADASEDPDGVGKSVEVTSIPDAGVVPGLHTIAARFDKAVLADGFKAYLQFIPSFRDALLRLAAGTKVLATTRSFISSITLTLPEADEQRAIASVIADADREIVTLRIRLAKARDVKQGMMQQLLTGHARLPVEEGAA
ncbi:restriction endonuclease subunit S [Actinomadura madurae]|nr:restriction endonuclease subunit S [Actinomadura madurae]